MALRQFFCGGLMVGWIMTSMPTRGTDDFTSPSPEFTSEALPFSTESQTETPTATPTETPPPVSVEEPIADEMATTTVDRGGKACLYSCNLPCGPRKRRMCYTLDDAATTATGCTSCLSHSGGFDGKPITPCQGFCRSGPNRCPEPCRN